MLKAGRGHLTTPTGEFSLEALLSYGHLLMLTAKIRPWVQ